MLTSKFCNSIFSFCVLTLIFEIYRPCRLTRRPTDNHVTSDSQASRCRTLKGILRQSSRHNSVFYSVEYVETQVIVSCKKNQQIINIIALCQRAKSNKKQVFPKQIRHENSEFLGGKLPVVHIKLLVVDKSDAGEGGGQPGQHCLHLKTNKHNNHVQ